MGMDNDCIEVKIVDIGNKNVLHTFEHANREDTIDVGVHGAGAKQNTSCIAQILWWGNM
jgi:hypothetical protein